MIIILMNKNTEVLKADYDSGTKGFSKIIKIINIEYAPLILRSCYDSKDDYQFRVKLSDWFRGRGIPSWRDKLDILLHRLNIDTPTELLDKAFGLSLSDQYWIKPEDMDVKYDDINFFDHNFDYSEFMVVSLSLNSPVIERDESLKTPNNTTDGMLRKAWIIENGKRYLLKSGYRNEILQPFNEVLASMICDRLGFRHVPYTLDVVKDMVVSKCECFINKDTELVTAYQIMDSVSRRKTVEDYETYIKILEEKGIANAREKVENMYIVDYLIMNEDRHLNNFGIIRDVNTLEWIDVAPIFDNGQALNVEYYSDDEVYISGQGRLFYRVTPFEEIIKVVKNLGRIDIKALDGIVEEFDNMLHEYQTITHISDGRIEKLCVILNEQINKLKVMV